MSALRQTLPERSLRGSTTQLEHRPRACYQSFRSFSAGKSTSLCLSPAGTVAGDRCGDEINCNCADNEARAVERIIGTKNVVNAKEVSPGNLVEIFIGQF